MSVGKGNGLGSKRTQFRRSLESQPIAYYKCGPNKGQPRICKLCPNFIHISTSRMPYCPTHMRQFHHQRRCRIKAADFMRRAAYWLNINHNPDKPLHTYTTQTRRPDYDGPFSHIPESYQQIAKQELAAILSNMRGPLTTQRYAASVACATAMAKYGGRKQWASHMRAIRLTQGYYRKHLLQQIQ